MPLSPKQKELFKLKYAKEQYIILSGGIRTGKTHWGATIGFFELIIHQQQTNPLYEGSAYMVLGHASNNNTYANVIIRINEYAKARGFQVKKINPQRFDFRYTRGNLTFTIETYSAPTQDSWLQFHGRTIRGIFIDEAAAIDQKNISQAIGRTSSFDDAKIVMTTNPMGSKQHWFYQTYLQDADEKGIKVIHFTMYDNPVNSLQKIESYKKLYTRNLFKQMVMGEWVIDDGAVYKKLPEVKQPKTISGIYFGLDYGEADATTVVAVGYSPDDASYYIIDQFYHSNRKDKSNNYNINDYQNLIVDFVNRVVIKYNVSAMFFVEITPISMYNLLVRDNRINRDISLFKANKKKTSKRSKDVIQERIDITNLLINNNRLFIVDKSLPIYEAFLNAEYDKNGNRLDDGTSDIDSLDAFEYAIKIDFKHIMNEMGYEEEFKDERTDV